MSDHCPPPLLAALTEAFLGRTCTVLTAATTLPLKDGIQHSQYFTGEVVKIDPFGAWVRHPQTGTLAFFAFPLLGIVEEQYIPPTDPRYAQIKDEIKRKEEAKAAPKAPPKPAGKPAQFVSVDDLTARLRAAQAKAT